MPQPDIKKARIAFEESFLADLKTILPKHQMTEIYHNFFASKSDAAFIEMVKQIDSGDLILPLIIPNFIENDLSTARNLKIGTEWGYEFRQHLTLTDPTDPSVTIVTPEKYLVTLQMVRRQSQTLESKRSIPENVDNIDDLSGQVTGESKGSSLTKPELHVLDYHQLENSIVELIKARGGDAEAWRKMQRSILTTGHVNLEDVVDGDSRTKATEVAEAWLKAAHIGNNFTGRN